MEMIFNINWENSSKTVDLFSLRNYPLFYDWVASPDGEKIAVVVENENRETTVWVNGKTWENVFERVCYLQFTPDNRLICTVQKDGLWTVAIDGNLWENSFDYVWNLQFNQDGKVIAVNVKVGNQYSVCVNDKPWQKFFYDARDLFISDKGNNIATYVRLENYPVLDILNFAKGMWSLAVNESAWDKKFISVFGCAFSPNGEKVAAGVRFSNREFSIAVDGNIWESTFLQVWEPVFLNNVDVLAPVKTEIRWQLYCNGRPFWEYGFTQIWNLRVHPAKEKIAGVIATDLGKWTVIVNGTPWKYSFSDLVLPPIFSPDGEKVAVAVKDKGKWGIVVDDEPWSLDVDRVWDPIFSPDGEKVAVRAEKGNKYFLVINDKIHKESFDYLWDPIFSPDGEKVLLRGIKGNTYYRKVLKIEKIIG